VLIQKALLSINILAGNLYYSVWLNLEKKKNDNDRRAYGFICKAHLYKNNL